MAAKFPLFVVAFDCRRKALMDLIGCAVAVPGAGVAHWSRELLTGRPTAIDDCRPIDHPGRPRSSAGRCSTEGLAASNIHRRPSLDGGTAVAYSSLYTRHTSYECRIYVEAAGRPTDLNSDRRTARRQVQLGRPPEE
jgi:hypothetical protein